MMTCGQYRNGLVRSVSVLVLGTVCGLPGMAMAQEISRNQSGIEEIVVTAQKREENLQRVPVSIVALAGEALENRGVSDVTDLRTVVPSLQIEPHPNSAATAVVFIRGIGNPDDQITQDPGVALYFDGVYVARSQGLVGEVAELQRVEVLRGPQGSLYGRNATGGAINFITKAPELGRFGAQQQLTLGNDAQFRSRTRVNIPLGETAALELGYLRSEKNGFVRNLGSGVKRFGDKRRDGYRAAMLWQPSEHFEIRYAYDRSDIEDTPAFLAMVPFYPAKADRPTAGSPFVNNLQRGDVTTQGHNLTATWKPGENLTLKSITGYRKLHNKTYQDYHTGIAGPFPFFTTAVDMKQKQFSQELQLIGEAFNSQIDYVLGAYYFDESAKGFDTMVTSQAVSDRFVTADNKSYAAYGQMTYSPDFLDGKLHLTAGLRWSKDKRQATNRTIDTPLAGLPVISPVGHGDRSFSNVSPTFVLAYDITDKVSAYAKVVRGYKTGGFNVRASSITRFNEGFDAETLTSYEAGLKSTLFDDRLRVNVAVHKADYKDIQINVGSDPNRPNTTDVLNAGEATIQGVELDITVKPARTLTLSASYSYLDAKYDKIIDAHGDNIAGSFVYRDAPKNTVSASLQYDFPQTPFGNPSLFVDYYYQSKVYGRVVDSRFVNSGYGLLNARLSLSDIPFAGGKGRVALFGRNLTNKNYYIAHFTAAVPTAIFGEPRAYGAELQLEF